MPIRDVIGIAGAAFFAVGGLLLSVSVHRGRKLCGRLASCFPDEYAAHGRPRPGFFPSERRSAYSRFVLRRRFTELPDPQLVAAFERLCKSEFRQLTFLVVGFAAFGMTALWLECASPLAPAHLPRSIPAE